MFREALESALELFLSWGYIALSWRTGVIREPGFDMVIISNCMKNVRKTTARTRRGTLIYTGHSQKTKEE